jgi:hypothetical protein
MISVRVCVLDDPPNRVETQRAEDALGQCVLPALGLIHANPCASNEVWAVLYTQPVTTRFRLYAQWKSMFSPEGPQRQGPTHFPTLSSKPGALCCLRDPYYAPVHP